MRRLFKLLIGGAALLIVGGYLLYTSRSAPPRAFEVSRRAAPLLPTGTVIDRGPPAGWTHLIVKSRPHPGTGDVGKIPALARPLTQLIFTSILARVDEYPDGSHALGAYGMGIGVNIDGKDTIVSPATQQQLGAKLGFFAREVLGRSYAKLTTATQVARSETMALFDSTAVIHEAGKHQAALYRHAVLVDAASGRLETLIWTLYLDAQGRPRRAAGPLVCLPASLVEEPALHVSGAEFTLGLPSDLAFACEDLPPGQRFAMPAAIESLAGQATLSPAQAQRLESELWQLLQAAR